MLMLTAWMQNLRLSNWCGMRENVHLHIAPNHNFTAGFRLDVVRKCMLKNKREAAGLGSPPDPYYTYDVESKNRVWSTKTVTNPISCQVCPVHEKPLWRAKARNRQGCCRCWRVSAEFSLPIAWSSSQRRFKKNQKQRKRILDRFGKAKLSPAEHNIDMSLVQEPGTSR